jgi:hypothetical protein
MAVWIMALVIFLIVLSVVVIPHKQWHRGGMCAGLWFARRITVCGVSESEAPSVIMHESVHHIMHHTEKLLVIFAGLLVTAAIIANHTEHPVTIFLLLGVVANIVENGMVKLFEYQAERAAIALQIDMANNKMKNHVLN